MADLVLEGGGVKGIALVGAATALDEAGWRFARVAGSSAGALVGAIIAAMQQAGEPMSRVDEIMRTLDYRKMLDRRAAAKALRWWPLAANMWGVLFHLGMYRGHYMTQWARGVLADLGVRTFADFAFDDPGTALPPGHSYRLVVTASDLSRQRLMYLPWDLSSYGVEAPDYPVYRAVRASSAIPFMFEPVRLRSTFGLSTLADGSLLRSYPIEIFDRHDGKPDRWPTHRHPAELAVQRAGAGQAGHRTRVPDPEPHLHDRRLDPGAARQRRGQCRPQHLRQAARGPLDRLRPHRRSSNRSCSTPAMQPVRSGSRPIRTARH